MNNPQNYDSDANLHIITNPHYMLGGVAPIISSGITAWNTSRIAEKNRQSNENINKANRQHSEKLQSRQLMMSLLQHKDSQGFQYLQQKDMQEFQQSLAEFNARNAREIAQLNHENAMELERFRQSVAIAINQKNLDFQKWRFEEEKTLQKEILQLQQDFQRELVITQHQQRLTEIRENLRHKNSPVDILTADLIENAVTNQGVMSLQLIISPPVLDFDNNRPESSVSNGYESFLAEEITQFLAQGYLNSQQYPVKLFDRAWKSKKQGGNSAIREMQKKDIPVKLLQCLE